MYLNGWPLINVRNDCINGIYLKHSHDFDYSIELI